MSEQILRDDSAEINSHDADLEDIEAQLPLNEGHPLLGQGLGMRGRA